jgi:hypothetical protein
MALDLAGTAKATAHSPAIGQKTLESLARDGNGKCPADVQWDARQAWQRFCACARALPAEEAAPLWRAAQAELARLSP